MFFSRKKTRLIYCIEHILLSSILRFHLSIYSTYKVLSFNQIFRFELLDLAKFRLTLNVNVDRKYYKSTLHDQKNYLSIRWDFFSKNKEFLVFFENTKNSSFSSTTIMIAQVIKQEISKRIRIFNLSIKLARDEKVKFFKKMILWYLYKFCARSQKSKFSSRTKKNQKIKLNNICVSNNFKFDNDVSWKKKHH